MSDAPSPQQPNEQVYDPTANVLQLVAAANQRQDDLRQSEFNHLREIIRIRSEYDGLLRIAEAKRIDAIRAVDVGAVNRAAEVQATQATTLAAQVAVSAETLRTQVANTAAAGAIALAAALEPIQKDIAELRKTQYEQAGQKVGTVETGNAAEALAAVLAPLREDIRSLREARSVNTGERQQKRYSTSLVFAGAGLLVAVSAVIGHLIH